MAAFQKTHKTGPAGSADRPSLGTWLISSRLVRLRMLIVDPVVQFTIWNRPWISTYRSVHRVYWKLGSGSRYSNFSWKCFIKIFFSLILAREQNTRICRSRWPFLSRSWFLLEISCKITYFFQIAFKLIDCYVTLSNAANDTAPLDANRFVDCRVYTTF